MLICEVFYVIFIASLSSIAVKNSLLFGIAFYSFSLVLIGSRLRALGNIMHECSHKSFVNSADANVLLGEILGVFLFVSFRRYCHEHRSHHRYLGSEALDLDLSHLRKFHFEKRNTEHFSKLLCCAVFLRFLPTYLRFCVWESSDRGIVRFSRLAFLGFIILMSTPLFGYIGLFYFILPLVSTYQIFRFYSDAADHAGCIAATDCLDRSRNHLFAHSILNIVFFPRNDAYHKVHHLFPALPTRHFPRVNDILSADKIYSEPNGEHSDSERDFRTAFLRQKS